MSNKTNNSSFSNPKLSVLHFFDSLVRLIDIHTERQLNNSSNNDVIESKLTLDMSSLDSFNLIKQLELEFAPIWDNNVCEQTPELDVSDNLNESDSQPFDFNRLRDDMISELDRAQKETLEYYDTIKDEIHKEMTQDEIESRIFARNYYFLLTSKNGSDLSMHLVKLDFYLNQHERDILG